MRCLRFLYVAVFSFLATIAYGDYPERIVQIDWGLRSSRTTTWDGQVRVSEGNLIAIPHPVYSHSEFNVYNQRISSTSWKMQTNLPSRRGGLYLKLRCPDDAVVTVGAAAFPFSFSLRELSKGTLQFQDGNITVREQTGTYFYVRTGKETGLYGKGEAVIEPSVARVNEYGTWDIHFTVGEYGIPVGGGIRISLHNSRSWGTPQYTDPAGRNYVTVRSTNSNAKLDYNSPDVHCCFPWPFPKEIILILVREEPLVPGDVVTVTLGDRSGGSPGFLAAQTNEQDTVFRVEVCTEIPDNYFPIYRVIENSPRVTIIPDNAVKVYLTAPSIVSPGETFELAVRMEDQFRNVAWGFEGDLELYVNGIPVNANCRFSTEDRGIVVIENLKLDNSGIYQFSALNREHGVEGKSNPVYCRENPPYRLYWGELHCHTDHSDGYGSKKALYTFLRDVARLDFAAISDHDVEPDSQDYSTPVTWRAAQYYSARFHEPHRFVTFPGWEWSPHRTATSGDHWLGDHNVYFLQEDPARNLLDATSEQFNTIDKLFRGLDTLNEKAFVIPHVGGNAGQWDTHSDKWQPLAEIYSVHGSFEAYGRLAIGKYGRKIGFIGGGDHHNGQGGGFPPSGVPSHHTHGGLAAIYSEELTRESLFDAITQRRTYGTSGPRILIDFSVNGNLMGSDIRSATNSEIKVLAHGEEPIWKVDIIKNGETVHTWINPGIKNEPEITVLWRNWYEDAAFDRASGRSTGTPIRRWNGSITISGTEIITAQPRSFTHPSDRITSVESRSVAWNSVTRGDWDGITLRLKNLNRYTVLNFNSGPHSFSLNPARSKERITPLEAGASNEMVLIVGTLENQTVSFTWKDDRFTENCYYYARVTQIDGEEAWASPVYVTHTR